MEVRGFSAIEQHIFFEEAKRVECADSAGDAQYSRADTHALRHGGTEGGLPSRHPRRDGEFAIGYSEPSAGSDLASLRTTAVRVGDEYVINGQKMFTSGAGSADYVWLAARTDPEAKRHKGISLFIVPTSATGFSCTPPLHTMPGVSTFYTFYDDVRVPASALVGEENDGWKLITTQLNFERAALGTLGALEPLFEKTLKWAAETMVDGVRVIDQPAVQLALARVEAQVAAYKLVNLRVNAAMAKGALEMGEASAAKVFGTELTQQVAGELTDILDRHGCPHRPRRPAARRSRFGGTGRGAQHVRRRCQRDPAHHHRHGGAGHAARAASPRRLTTPEGSIAVDFSFSEDQVAIAKIARDLLDPPGHPGSPHGTGGGRHPL